MVAPDPLDARILTVLAEMGRAAVQDIAVRVGMDAREVAARLLALSASGLPLVVGVECDPNGIRAALTNAGFWGGGYGPPGTQAGTYSVPGMPGAGYPGATPTGPYPGATPTGPYPGQGAFGGAYPAQGAPSGPYPPQPGPASGPYPVPGTPSGPFPPQGTPSGAYPTQAGPTSGPFHPPPQYAPAPSIPSPAANQPVPATPGGADPMSTWGPPQSSSWARGDQPTRPVPGRFGSGPRTGTVGTTLETEGLEGEQLAITLVEVVDPADYLFTAAGYRLREGERSVVVHTELTNRGVVPFASLPDMYLVLVTSDGQMIPKAPVSLSSRTPHRIGVAPGETVGGHTVYVLPEPNPVVAVRWSPQPDAQTHTLTWTVGD